jgi:glycerophosphoryl diester phosphodiesterase
MSGAAATDKPNVMIIGHRGARNLWPENSLQGFRRTRELGIDGVEFDVHMARDGELVVIHDPTLDRTTHGTGPVAQYTSAELAAVRLRDGDGEGVPTLDAVLAVFAGTTMELQIEIKTNADGRRYKDLERRLLETIERHGVQDRTVITSFVAKSLAIVREASPRQQLLASISRRSADMAGGLDPALERIAALGSCIVAVEMNLLSEQFDLFQARIGAERIGVWTPNEPEEIARWLARPIRELTTDRPDLALKLRAANR